MKKIISALLLVSLAACSKAPLDVPKQASESIAANTAVSYKDNNVSVVNFKAQPDKSNIKVTFTTLYAKNIVKLEVLKGITTTNLCSIYKQDVNADTYSAMEYNTSDVNEVKSSNIYYMVKYTLVSGDWGYTPVFKLSL